LPGAAAQATSHGPAAWDGLGAITAPTLLIGGGPESHIPQDKLIAVAARIPRCDPVTIPTGHMCMSLAQQSLPRQCSAGCTLTIVRPLAQNDLPTRHR
jgi:pimeloyl-ACP methyl ester carboxylesterase